MLKEYKKIATVKAKLFEEGDEDGMTFPSGVDFCDSMENNKLGCKQPNLVPYISTLENQKLRGQFGEHYVCVGLQGERWLVEKSIFEETYQELSKSVTQSLPSDDELIKLAKSTCMLHKTNNELGFLVTFDLKDLRQFCNKLISTK